MHNYILLAETGSDIPADLAKRYGVETVPMHVAFGDETRDDGTFPTTDIYRFFERTGTLTKTSGSTVGDFETVFDRLQREYPGKPILHLAYSAVTTCSYQSAIIASEDRDYVTAIDTKQVSIGQAAVVVEVAKYLQANPAATLAQACDAAMARIETAKMCFLPDNLEFLRAGGRVSNVVCLGSRILSLHPCIEILEGKLIATKKYRGKMAKVAAQLIQDYTQSYQLDRQCLWLVHTVGLSDEVRKSAEQAAEACGFAKVQWIQANGVITTHGGPAAFGMAGFSIE